MKILVILSALFLGACTTPYGERLQTLGSANPLCLTFCGATTVSGDSAGSLTQTTTGGTL